MFRKTLLLTLLLALFIAGCAPATEAPVSAAITLTDGLGRPVVMNGAAQRIISLAPSNTEILFAVGAGAQVIGRDAYSDYPAEALDVADIGDTYAGLNTELIVSLKPDLILAAEINTAEQVKALEDLGLTVYYLKNPNTLEEMYTNLEIVAQLTGQDPTKLTDSLKARVAAVDEKILPLSSRISVFYELDGTDPAKPYTAGSGTFINLLIERAGGYNIASDIEGYPQLSLEQVVAADPMFIVLGDSAFGVTAEAVAARPGWENLSAVKSGQVLPFDDNLLSRPGPRLVDGLEALAKLLRPGLFE
ncbi:MAG: cobalamin-binding protein [Anaerolineales bacterium]|uniref:ABC transporter substrate-binding protein n=1 Tax=Candidatus Villigracilis proximus TaxID=3140683 RepID=UPI003135F9C2|nr:cobalamin-binding protein [Anaerolineales bacterium]MBK9208959.1 cobalamin-binding protein [Anaerolineales bacterium]